MAGILFAIIVGGFLVQSVIVSARSPYWMDEVLSLWTARQPDVASVWSALVHGSEFTPPVFDLLLHGLIALGATGPVAMRLPSIAAICLAALAILVLVRRRSGYPQAFAAAAIVLSSGIFEYAVQVRPYACVTACFAWALVVWDRPLSQTLPLWRLVALGLLLALSVALHFYALLLVGALGLAELARHRAASPAVLAVIALAGASILLWWPILHAARVYSGGDVFAPDYYGRPTLHRLRRTYLRLFAWTSLPLAVLATAVLFYARRQLKFSATAGLSLLLLAIPVIVYAFALLISHSYAERYAIAVVLGLALLVAWLIDSLGRASLSASMLVLAILILVIPLRSNEGNEDRARIEAAAGGMRALGDLPVVVHDGLRFFELMENLPPELAARLVYLDIPGLSTTDPTDRRQATGVTMESDRSGSVCGQRRAIPLRHGQFSVLFRA